MRTNARPAASTPDLSTYLRVHRALRTSAAQLAAAASAPPVDARAARALARWYHGFAEEVRLHHHIEDTLLFPALATRVETYGEYAPALQTDHAELDAILDQLAAALDGGDHQRSAPLAEDLRAHLDRHLQFEDDEIVPLFARHVSGAEYDELNAKAVRMAPLRQLPFTAPWLLSHLDSAERAKLLDSAPRAMHLLWILTRRRYARLAEAALNAR
jgi:hemerythrin-like domain-containing protein